MFICSLNDFDYLREETKAIISTRLFFSAKSFEQDGLEQAMHRANVLDNEKTSFKQVMDLLNSNEEYIFEWDILIKEARDML